MIKFIFSRLLQSILTLFAVMVLVFVLLQLMPGDAVTASRDGLIEKNATWAEKENYEKTYQEAAKDINVDLPLFYFSIGKVKKEKAFYQVVLEKEKKLLNELSNKNISFQTVQKYIFALKNLEKKCYTVSEDTLFSVVLRDSAINILSETRTFFSLFEKNDIQNQFEKTKNLASQNLVFQAEIKMLGDAKNEVLQAYNNDIVWVPKFSWYGTQSQFHIWLKKTLSGDFGISRQSYRPVWTEIKDAIVWTLMISILSLILIFAIGIPLGLRAAAHFGKKLDKRILNLTFFLDAIPEFWLATLVLVYLTNSHYHLKIFPEAGLPSFSSDASLLKKMVMALPHFIAPIVCIVLTSVSIIIRQMRASSLNVINQQYIKTATAKGLSNDVILKKHVFPNAIFPIIALIGVSLPTLIAGTLVIETTFNIPGMGMLAANAVVTQNFSLVMAIVILTSTVTILGSIISDVLYKIFDPKV